MTNFQFSRASLHATLLFLAVFLTSCEKPRDDVKVESGGKNSPEVQKAIEMSEAEQKLINNLIRESGAVDWESTLAIGDPKRSKPIYTVELEKTWISGRPIVFVGTLNDISSIDTNQYHLSMGGEPHIFWSLEVFRLELSCPKNVVTPVWENINLYSNTLDLPRVAATVQIERIQQATEIDRDGITTHVFTGFGQCIALTLLTNNG